MMLFQSSKFSILLLSGILVSGAVSESAVAQDPAAVTAAAEAAVQATAKAEAAKAAAAVEAGGKAVVAAQNEAAKAGAATAGDAPAAGQDNAAIVEKVGLVMGHNMATNYKKQNPDANVADILKGVKAAEADQLSESFMFGYQMMSRIKSQDAGITAAQLEAGMQKAIAGEELGVSDEETQMLMTAFSRLMEQKRMAKLKATGDANDAEGKAYIQQQISSNPNLKELSDGIYYEVLVAGEGESPTAASRVKVDYEGSFTNGEVFDTSLEPSGGRPASPAVFPVGGVIPGFSKALRAMKPGGKWRVLIPGEQAYGVRGSGQKIGPMQTLIFELSLLEVVEPPAKPAKPAAVAPSKPATEGATNE